MGEGIAFDGPAPLVVRTDRLLRTDRPQALARKVRPKSNGKIMTSRTE